ncbi:hypothetical protein CONLIGDRAFT_159396 [Coniochaeta ligniaria NRRL 30616]|uniref:Uncharacterized protein n=1 Tax=Coniochaeta ligniaria NRRL 30616 TaxID=1408157 RepID=A0A1J7IZQ1_9PEZI|nr:hypothetical protein CONLIGDRAFT_159396 [Coniochaeta ligniaria NRRL 30616]
MCCCPRWLVCHVVGAWMRPQHHVGVHLEYLTQRATPQYGRLCVMCHRIECVFSLACVTRRYPLLGFLSDTKRLGSGVYLAAEGGPDPDCVKGRPTGAQDYSDLSRIDLPQSQLCGARLQEGGGVSIESNLGKLDLDLDRKCTKAQLPDIPCDMRDPPRKCATSLTTLPEGTPSFFSPKSTPLSDCHDRCRRRPAPSARCFGAGDDHCVFSTKQPRIEACRTRMSANRGFTSTTSNPRRPWPDTSQLASRLRSPTSEHIVVRQLPPSVSLSLFRPSNGTPEKSKANSADPHPPSSLERRSAR